VKSIPVKDEYGLKLTAMYADSRGRDKVLKWGSFVHFRANVTTSSAPFGQGIVTPLMQTYSWVNTSGEVIQTPTPLELRHSTRRSMMKGFEKFSFGNELWCFPETADPAISELNEKVKTMQDTGERVVTNAKGTVQIAVPQRTTSYDEWLKVTQAEFNALLEDPALKIHTETIFAKATAEEETKLFQKKVLAMQRVLKRQIEALWSKCLQEWGFDPVQAKARMNFGAPTVPEYNIADILTAVRETVISKDEARQMLREARWKIIEGEAPKDKGPDKLVLKEQLIENSGKQEKVEVSLNLEQKPLKHEFILKQEPLKHEITIKQEPHAPQEVILKHEYPQKDAKLEEQRDRLLKKLLDKLEKRQQK